ncbi:2-oxoglutarate-dependent dioxygenase DAO-like [Senna tora]|uniref:2-oxoglutarate-dependent dioxygenase DAO-like n=1 Tax=Senna tora TaxID=362788 RepID=A0A834TV33_9FABA|nr:2-oxoglutarate-dependent dioxygenase DAO-like [Senna tora]
MERGMIPVIDVKKLSDGSEEELKKLREACEEWGCFRILNHPIPLGLMEEIQKVVGSLLDLPTEIRKNNSHVIPGSGFIPSTTSNPLYQANGIYDSASSEAVEEFCSQLNASPYQREILEAYGKAIQELAEKLGEKMGESLGLRSVGVEYFKDWPCSLRFNKYNFNPETLGQSGLQLHTDTGFLTIVLQDDENVDGLQVMHRSGSFVEAPSLPGTFFVNLGDVAHHGVMCKKASRRLSIVTFLLGPREGNVEIPDELVDSDHPRLFVPFTYKDFRNLRLSKNLRVGEALHLLRIP